MPVIESSLVVPVPPATAFAVSQTTGATRMRWDPFIRRQHLMDGAIVPGKGVRTLTVHRLGFRMVSEYVSYNPPTNVGMKMLTGSWFFERLGGGWRFGPVEGDPNSTLAVWRYNFACKPAWLAPLAERIGSVILQRDIDRRIAGFARGCSDPIVLAAITQPTDPL
ncbi:SRPBCC family protein [Glaciihabitans arcticus]|uniref:SRPBCC family protein n=1 Tax=Glaciihabitans arcticus TaxID=2668039 RepID=A0A4Q9GTE7_9MICO|nr:SRPBCC family protein [Glaciihabitans arcticus]TBN56908.1 SRPBCC family protein [Glaciihabitans arcticus]